MSVSRLGLYVPGRSEDDAMAESRAKPPVARSLVGANTIVNLAMGFLVLVAGSFGGYRETGLGVALLVIAHRRPASAERLAPLILGWARRATGV
jgi:hypothetical protein